MSLTFMQRILRRPINWAVERYFPDGCFYGDSDPMKTFERNDGETVGRAATMVLIRHCHDNDASELNATFSGVTIKGVDIGNWRVLVEKLMTPPVKYGNRNVAKMYAQINTLRAAIRAEGSPAIQTAWDAVEEHIDFAYGQNSRKEAALSEMARLGQEWDAG